MSERKYLCRVDDSGHELGRGWRAELTVIDGGYMPSLERESLIGGWKDVGEAQRFQVLIPYSHRIFEDATACFAPEKKVVLTFSRLSDYPIENGYTILSDENLDAVVSIEPYRERMYPDNWPEPPETVH